jgi:peptide/nickel transport system permease protein
MTRFIAGRIAQGLITMILVSVIVFLMAHATGNPAELMLPPTATAHDVAVESRLLGTSQPLVVQYLTFVGHAVHGDLGDSIRYQVPVSELLAPRVAASLLLGLCAMVFAAAVGGALGTARAFSESRLLSRALGGLSLIGVSIPSFWLGIVLVQLFGLDLRWLPVAGMQGPASVVLPACTLGLFVAGGMSRLLRSTLDESLGSLYVTAARARGVRDRAIVFRHVLRNAVGPVLAFAGVNLPLLVSSAVVVESVFAWPGLGSLAYNAVIARDFPVIQGVTLVGSGLVVTISLVVDVLQAVVDPRIRRGMDRG